MCAPLSQPALSFFLSFFPPSRSVERGGGSSSFFSCAAQKQKADFNSEPSSHWSTASTRDPGKGELETQEERRGEWKGEGDLGRPRGRSPTSRESMQLPQTLEDFRLFHNYQAIIRICSSLATPHHPLFREISAKTDNVAFARGLFLPSFLSVPLKSSLPISCLYIGTCKRVSLT